MTLIITVILAGHISIAQIPNLPPSECARRAEATLRDSVELGEGREVARVAVKCVG